MGSIIVVVHELILIIEDFFKQIFRIAVELPIVNIIVIGIEIIVISTEERPQLVGIEVIHRIKVIDRGASPHPFIRGIGEITRICSESSKTALPVSRTAYLANLLIEVIGKFRVVFLRFTQVIVLRCVCAERKTAVRGSRREQHRDNAEYKQYHNDRYRQTKKELFDFALIDILHEFPSGFQCCGDRVLSTFLLFRLRLFTLFIAVVLVFQSGFLPVQAVIGLRLFVIQAVTLFLFFLQTLRLAYFLCRRLYNSAFCRVDSMKKIVVLIFVDRFLPSRCFHSSC